MAEQKNEFTEAFENISKNSERALVDSVNKTEDAVEEFFKDKLDQETKKKVKGVLTKSDTAKRLGIDQIAKNDSPEAIKEAVRKIGAEAIATQTQQVGISADTIRKIQSDVVNDPRNVKNYKDLGKQISKDYAKQFGVDIDKLKKETEKSIWAKIGSGTLNAGSYLSMPLLGLQTIKERRTAYKEAIEKKAKERQLTTKDYAVELTKNLGIGAGMLIGFESAFPLGKAAMRKILGEKDFATPGGVKSPRTKSWWSNKRGEHINIVRDAKTGGIKADRQIFKNFHEMRGQKFLHSDARWKLHKANWKKVKPQWGNLLVPGAQLDSAIHSLGTGSDKLMNKLLNKYGIESTIGTKIGKGWVNFSDKYTRVLGAPGEWFTVKGAFKDDLGAFKQSKFAKYLSMGLSNANRTNINDPSTMAKLFNWTRDGMGASINWFKDKAGSFVKSGQDIISNSFAKLKGSKTFQRLAKVGSPALKTLGKLAVPITLMMTAWDFGKRLKQLYSSDGGFQLKHIFQATAGAAKDQLPFVDSWPLFGSFAKWADQKYLGKEVEGIDNLPKMNQGGRIHVQGRPGIDTNTLQLNHRPIAKVSTGETIDVLPKMNQGGQILVDNMGGTHNSQLTSAQFLRQSRLSQSLQSLHDKMDSILDPNSGLLGKVNSIEDRLKNLANMGGGFGGLGMRTAGKGRNPFAGTIQGGDIMESLVTSASYGAAGWIAWRLASWWNRAWKNATGTTKMIGTNTGLGRPASQFSQRLSAFTKGFGYGLASIQDAIKPFGDAARGIKGGDYMASMKNFAEGTKNLLKWSTNMAKYTVKGGATIFGANPAAAYAGSKAPPGTPLLTDQRTNMFGHTKQTNPYRNIFDMFNERSKWNFRPTEAAMDQFKAARKAYWSPNQARSYAAGNRGTGLFDLSGQAAVRNVRPSGQINLGMGSLRTGPGTSGIPNTSGGTVPTEVIKGSTLASAQQEMIRNQAKIFGNYGPTVAAASRVAGIAGAAYMTAEGGKHLTGSLAERLRTGDWSQAYMDPFRAFNYGVTGYEDPIGTLMRWHENKYQGKRSFTQDLLFNKSGKIFEFLTGAKAQRRAKYSRMTREAGDHPAGATIPEMARGGSMVLGGESGRDRNILQLNNQPIARVSEGERLDVTPKDQFMRQVNNRSVNNLLNKMNNKIDMLLFHLKYMMKSANSGNNIPMMNNQFSMMMGSGSGMGSRTMNRALSHAYNQSMGETGSMSSVIGMEFEPGENKYISQGHTSGKKMNTSESNVPGIRRAHENVDITNLTGDTKQALIALKRKFGKPLTITSGYRSPAYNKKVGGATNSLHKRGRAVDIVTAGMSGNEKAKLLSTGLDVGFTSPGFYSSFLHLDTRQSGATWNTQPKWARQVMRSQWMPGMKPKQTKAIANDMAKQITQPLEQNENSSGRIVSKTEIPSIPDLPNTSNIASLQDPDPQQQTTQQKGSQVQTVQEQKQFSTEDNKNRSQPAKKMTNPQAFSLSSFPSKEPKSFHMLKLFVDGLSEQRLLSEVM